VTKRLAAWIALLALWPVPDCPAAGAPPRIVLDQVYAPSGQRLDLCVPSEVVRKSSTVVVFIHGGGFVSGDKADMRGFCELYAKAGYVSATLNYRLAGQAPYPAAEQDVEAALAWIAAKIQPYDAPVRKLVLVGYSAGGTLALLAEHPLVAARVSAAGPTDLRALLATTPHEKLKTDLAAFLRGADPDVASPIRRPQLTKTPVYLFHGKIDKLVPVAQSLSLAQALQSQGGKVLLRVFDGVGHEVMLPNPHLAELLDELARFVSAAG
jgi:acetyl esterase/lipase